MKQLATIQYQPKILVVKKQDRLFLLADLSILLVMFTWLIAVLDIGQAVTQLVSAYTGLILARLDLWLAVGGCLGRAVVWSLS